LKRKDWLWVLIPLAISWGIDRITKMWASGLMSHKFYTGFGFILHHNHGAILGIFSDIPSVLRIVSLSTGGAFLLFLFCILQFLLPTKSLPLRAGLSFLIGGIIGNVTDRIMWGYVVDFIVIGTPQHFSPAFNFADAIQWVGYGLVVITFLKDGQTLWPIENLRKSYWINPKFQLKYCFTLMLCGMGLTLILGTYCYTYLKVAIKESGQGLAGLQPETFLNPFVFTFVIVSLTFCMVLFVVGLVLSHRAAGPLYAFERFLNDHIDGKPATLKLRTGDEFMELEKLAKKLTSSPRSSRTKSG
jgi:signal peptidase II